MLSTSVLDVSFCWRSPFKCSQLSLRWTPWCRVNIKHKTNVVSSNCSSVASRQINKYKSPTAPAKLSLREIQQSICIEQYLLRYIPVLGVKHVQRTAVQSPESDVLGSSLERYRWLHCIKQHLGTVNQFGGS